MKSEMYYAIIPAVFVALAVAFGILLLFGKAAILIPGYNFKAKGERAQFFERIYTKYVGMFVLILTVFFILIFFGLFFNIPWVTGIGGGTGVCYALCGVIAIKNSRKISESRDLAKILTRYPDYLSDEEYENVTTRFTKKTKTQDNNEKEKSENNNN